MMSLHGKTRLCILLLIIFSCAKFCTAFGSADRKIQISTLMSEAVNYFIGRLQEDSTFPQTRAGGGFGLSGGGPGHGAITLDPVSIISLLALGAFLINNILQLLRANTRNNSRSLGGQSPFDNLALLSSTFHGINNLKDDEPGFVDFFKNVGSLYYLQPKKRHMCMKRVVCNYLNMKESRQKGSDDLKHKIFDFMLYANQTGSTVTKIVAPEMDEEDKEEKCLKMHKFCSDDILQDARVSVEYKIYSKVSTWLTKLAFNGLASG